MNSTQRELWIRLEAFGFDEPGTTLTFARRLARENGWTHAFAENVITEYRRFVFLAMEAGHPVSPSEEVDQAWHLHLTYTQSYWQRLCGEVLGRRLHHNPTKGGADEAAKFDGQYRRTLESYRRLFGEEPPAAIWPPAETRNHAHAGGHRWVDTAKNWVVPKWLAWAFAAGGAAGFFALGAAGCSATPAGMLGIFDLPGPEFLGLFVGLTLVGLLGALLTFRRGCGPHGMPPSANIPSDDYEIAYLAGGGPRVMQTALVALYADKAVAVCEDNGVWIKRGEPPHKAQHDIEVLLWGLLPEDGKMVQVKTIMDGMRGALAKIEAGLAKKQLLSANCQQAAWMGLAVALIAPAIGGIKVGLGLWRDRPVGVLFFLTLGATVVAVLLFTSFRKQKRSGQGGKALKLLRQSRGGSGHGKPDIDPAHVPVGLAAALFGLSALPLYGYDDLSKHLKQGAASTGGGCGSSCGGGGCGGGGCGGGCGGCGD